MLGHIRNSFFTYFCSSSLALWGSYSFSTRSRTLGAVVFSIIMVVRILLSTLISCFVYSHPVTELGFVGIFMVFGSIAYRIRRKTEGRALIRWKKDPIKTVEARKVFSEWHEHLDDC